MDDYIIRKIKEAARIEDIVCDFVALHRKGARLLGLCPFHDDRHEGSFVVYPKGNCYKCFSCGAKGGPIDFLVKHASMSFVDAVRWIGRKYCIETDGEAVKFTPPPPRPTLPPLKMLRIPAIMVESRSATIGDNLCDWLRGLPWNGTQKARVEDVLSAYHVGHSRKGHTIFWQIDDMGVIRTGKMMKYKKDGHRDKDAKYNFDWVHAALFRARNMAWYDSGKMEARPCLFGLHLIDKWPNAQVNIVESEKTAIIMAIAYGNNERSVWMACGGLHNISEERLSPIIKRNRKINLFPDRDGVSKWKEKAKTIKYETLKVMEEPVTLWWEDGDGEKADIGDVVLRFARKHADIINK